MAKKKPEKPAGPPAKSKKKAEPPPWQEVVQRRIARVRDVDAIFYGHDSVGVCHVYWVVEEHHGAPYRALLRQEDLISQEYPDVPFYFHVWARQGRTPAQAVPRGLEPLFIRHER